jgi:hypothetical protein
MSEASAVVASAEDAVAAADASEQAMKPRGSAEVAAAPKAAASKKYTAEEKAAAKRAEALRTKPRSVSPVQVQRAQSALKGAEATPEAIVKSFKSIKDATAFAGGDKSIERPELVKQVGEHIADPFSRSA